ncbi:ribosomal protein S5 domain 2-type protein [Linnemannia elongata]|nr:ribosomal protein S5 domain 2-type protein [Linnemannia elongata]
MLHMEKDRDTATAPTVTPTTTTGQQGGELSSQSRPMGSKVPLGTFVYASAPARIDLAGGWTDTIPITHEHGGKVVNVAVQVNNRAPYTVKARRTEALILSLSYDPNIPSQHFHSIEQIRDHADPLVPGALLKACLVASGILGITAMRHDGDYKTMAEALKHSGGGLELEIRSSLPVGSGMGTSSILIATILAVLKTLMGKPYTNDDLFYETLDVEQMMNTGGGWQDQVGGIMPGFKVSTCELDLPIQLKTNTIEVPEEFITTFNSRLLLIYTGKTRLAKNLLQTVLMNWAGQEPDVVDTMHRLVADATQCEDALRQGDLRAVGTVLTRYFADKRYLSETTLSHPPIIAHLLSHLSPHLEGFSLAGAGGGGFLAAILKPGLEKDQVVKEVREAMALDRNGEGEEEVDGDSMWGWSATVDRQGLVVQVGSPCY